MISRSLIDRFSTGPSVARLNQAKSLRAEVKEALGDQYRVFLQGSYRNGTGVADLNDVDVVALAKTVHSTKNGPPALNPVSWDEIFQRVEVRLNQSPRFAGLVERGDKCVKIDTDLSVDVVPAIYTADPDDDPIVIHSFRGRESRDNFPRDHYEAGVSKNAATDGNYKPTVRLFKRWARQVFSDPATAPSFYIECAVHAVPNDAFKDNLSLGFASVALKIYQWDKNTVLMSVAGDKDVLMSDEWAPAKFERFRERLLPSVEMVLKALEAPTNEQANRLWREAFGE